MTKQIDLNCDMGEGMDNDAKLMPLISSANIACGYHAGNDSIMRATVELAKQSGVSIGAHPGFADKENFGRTEMQLSSNELYQLIWDQLVIMQTITQEASVAMHHVKPHGALYNMAACDVVMARIICQAVKDFDANLILYGLSGSYLISEAKALGLTTASEVFADRTYQDNGSLTPRSQPNAMIHDQVSSLAQVLQMIQEQTVVSVTGKTIPISAETICIHGDGTHAVSFAQQINTALQTASIKIQSPQLLSQ
jgi:5-oxoprolinase (ATP-hydrolysing) subunit A